MTRRNLKLIDDNILPSTKRITRSTVLNKFPEIKTFEHLYTRVLINQETLINWYVSMKLISSEKHCNKCFSKMEIKKRNDIIDGYAWYCSNNECKSRISAEIKVGSQNQNYPTTFCWCYEMTQKLTMREVSISKNTAVDWFSFMRCICIDILEMYSKPLGGPGKVVEIDESAFGKRKYNRGARRKTYWIFGGIERNANPPKTGFEHLTVYHTIEFKNPETGAHTNNIEGTWFHLKRSLPRHGTNKSLLAIYFAEFIWRKKFGDFNDIINNISELFPAGEVDEFDIEGTNPDEYEK